MKSTLIFMLLVLATADEFDNPFDVLGDSVPTRLDAYTQLISDAQHNPNATRSVGFKPFRAATEASSALALRDAEWIWRINVSDFAAPDAGARSATEDPHVVSTAYDFSGSEDLSDQLNQTASGFCLSVVSWDDLPVNITNTFTTEDANDTSCIPVLGQACVDAILSNGSNFRGPACAGPKTLWSELPECQNTLGYVESTDQGFGTLSFSRGLGNNSHNGTGAFGHGQGWFGAFSAAQNGSGSPAYYTAVNQLQIAMASAVLSLKNDGGYLEGAELLCMRVNATRLPTKDTNDDGTTWTSEAVMESMAGLVRPGGIWVLLGMTALVSMLQ